MTSMIVTQALSKQLYELFVEGDSQIKIQVPFVDKQGNSLPDEDIEYSNIFDCTKELLESGASALFYIRNNETFLLPYLIDRLENTGIYSPETKTKVIDLVINSITEKELEGLLPEHSNLLIKQMTSHEKELNTLLTKGLCFKQDTNNRYGNEPEEVSAIREGNAEFFMNIAKNHAYLDFDTIYNKGRYNETTLRQEVINLKDKIQQFEESVQKAKDRIDGNSKDKEKNKDKYLLLSHQKRKNIVEFLDKWMIKNKLEAQEAKSNTVKPARNKI